MIQQLKSKLLVILLLLVSYGISGVLVKYLFVRDSNKINTEYIAGIKRDVLLVFDKTFNKSQNQLQIQLEESKQKAIELAQEKVLKQIAPGIKAAETSNAGYYRVTLSDMSYSEYKEFTIHGKTIRIRTKTGTAPSQQVLDAIARNSK